MISDKDRSYYIGASDTKYVIGNYDTKTFRHWWDVKMGFIADTDYDSIYIMTGNLYEPKILDWLECTERDRQIIIGRLRVNLDGETEDSVIEIKTFRYDGVWKPPKAYLHQVQVEMFATGKDKGYLVGYGVDDDDYYAVINGETLDIDARRIFIYPIERDDKWLDEVYLPRLWYLAECLEEERLPCTDDLSTMKKC